MKQMRGVVQRVKEI
jgi:hypothetical protein